MIFNLFSLATKKKTLKYVQDIDGNEDDRYFSSGGLGIYALLSSFSYNLR